MKILITGSHGFIGSALVDALSQAGIPFDIVQRDVAAPAQGEFTYSPLGYGIWRIRWPDGLSILPFESYSTIVHLALPRPNPHHSHQAASEEHCAPVRTIIQAIQKANAGCSLLFLSSQSASESAISGYGRGKWSAEQLIRSSAISWTIIQPGLIVGNSTKGLFGGIMGLVQKSPIIPVPSGAPMFIDPILLSDIIDACMKILMSPMQHNGQLYQLALPRRSLFSFIRQMCRDRSLVRLLIPIPWQLISFGLRLTEFLPLRLPFSRGNLEGLLASNPLVSDESVRALGITLHEPHVQLNLETKAPSAEYYHKEASYLFQSLFRAPAPDEVLNHYIAAHRTNLFNGKWINMPSIISNNLDAEAIEYAVRSRKTILSQKLQALCYIAEISPHLLDNFIQRRQQRARAFISLGIAGVVSSWKLVYGHYLVRRFALLEERRAHD